MMPDRSRQGQPERHTQPGAAPAVELDQAALEAAAMPGADPDALLRGSPDLGAPDLLAVAAELVAAPSRARGRPAGAANRKNGDMVAYLAALGHRDPWVTLSMIQTADTVQLSRQLQMERGAVLGLQLRAAETLMSYHHAKRPQQVELPLGDKRPLMVIGEMNVTIGGVEDGWMSAGENVNEINGDVVRDNLDVSHDEAK